MWNVRFKSKAGLPFKHTAVDMCDFAAIMEREDSHVGITRSYGLPAVPVLDLHEVGQNVAQHLLSYCASVQVAKTN